MHHPSYAGGDQRLGAGAGAAGVVAGLQGHHGGPARGAVPRLGERGAFGVRTAGRCGGAGADDDAVAVLREQQGVAPEVLTWTRAARLPHDAAWVTRRLCLPADRVDEVAVALVDLPPRRTDAVTLTWSP